MSTKPRAFARRAAQVLAATVVGGSGVLVAATPAFAAVAITGVTVVNSSGKVVGPGSTIAIAGSGFAGMLDNASTAGNNAANSSCTTTPAAGCTQVRFIGVNAGATAADTTTITVASNYTVVSDSLIYAAVPTMPTGTAGYPSPGYGIISIGVENGLSASTPTAITASTTTPGIGQLVYRHPLTAEIAGAGTQTVKANATGGGVLNVGVSGGVALTSTSFPRENITALFTLIPASQDSNHTTIGSPNIIATAVTWDTSSNIKVTVPPGATAGEDIAVELVHDGIRGTADYGELEYAAAINKIETCTGVTWSHQLATTPDCTGPASAPAATGNVYVELQGKGFTGLATSSGGTATVPTSGVDFTGPTTGAATSTCTVKSDTLAFCTINVTVVPPEGAVIVTFFPADPPGSDFTTPAVAVTPGALFLFADTV